MYQPTTRLLTVLELLQARPRLSGTELAQRLEVDIRTVRRYMTMLQDMGIPVEADHGRYGGYRLRPGFKLPPLLFTEEEALAVTLGLLAARRLGLAATAPAVEGALAKIERVLPTEVAERISALQDSIGFSQSVGRSAPASGDVLLSLSSATRQRLRVHLRYRDRADAESERDFDPYGLVFHYGRWYLVGQDQRSRELRTFRVDRILDVTPRGETFERPEGFDAVAHLRQSLASMPWGYEVEVLLPGASVAEVRAMIPEHVGAVEEVEGGAVFRTQSDDLRWTAVYLPMLRRPFVVLRPEELKEELRAVGEELIAAAGPPP